MGMTAHLFNWVAATSEINETIIPVRGFEITNNQMKIKLFLDIWSDHASWQQSEPYNKYGSLLWRPINL